MQTQTIQLSLSNAAFACDEIRKHLLRNSKSAVTITAQTFDPRSNVEVENVKKNVLDALNERESAIQTRFIALNIIQKIRIGAGKANAMSGITELLSESTINKEKIELLKVSAFLQKNKLCDNKEELIKYIERLSEEKQNRPANYMENGNEEVLPFTKELLNENQQKIDDLNKREIIIKQKLKSLNAATKVEIDLTEEEYDFFVKIIGNELFDLLSKK